MQIGRKIYYELSTGNVIQDTGERQGSVVETTQEQDFEAYVSLAERVPSTVGCIQIDFGQYVQDFMECNGYRVDISGASPTLVFSYPDPSVPDVPPVYKAPLTTQVEELKSQNADIIFALVSNNLM
jgi:hypothetical protein